MRVYLDHNATTPLEPGVLSEMVGVLEGDFANPNSTHREGVQARYRIEKSRRELARLLGVSDASSLVYTSGGSEADNLALRGVCIAARERGSGNHLVVGAAEHKAVLETAFDLRNRYGFELTVVPVDSQGRVLPNELSRALRSDTVLVSVIAANNEVGTLNDIPLLASVVHDACTAVFHTDAVQWVGRLPLDIGSWGADLVTIAAHKMYGPKGVGALYIRPGTQLAPQILGGGHERGMRAGTENVAAIVGFTTALRMALKDQAGENQRLTQLRKEFWVEIAAVIPDAVRNSPVENCLSNTLNFSLPGLPGQRLVAELDRLGFALSAGSACTSTGETGSHVVAAMGADAARSAGTLRVSLGKSNSPDHAKDFARALVLASEKVSREFPAVKI